MIPGHSARRCSGRTRIAVLTGPRWPTSPKGRGINMYASLFHSQGSVHAHAEVSPYQCKDETPVSRSHTRVPVAPTGVDPVTSRFSVV